MSAGSHIYISPRAEACRGQVQRPAEGLPCPAVPALMTGARVYGSHNSGQSFLKTNGREGRVSNAQKYAQVPKRANAISHESSNHVESPTVKVKDGAQPPPRSQLNLCSPCETGIDRQRKDSHAWKPSSLNAAESSETTRDDN